MKNFILSILTFGLFACNNITDKKSLDNETANESLIQIDSSYVDTIAITKDNLTCDFDRFLKDPKIPKLAKDLINNKAKNPSDNEPLDYFDKLKSKDIEEREFYFRAITNSYRIADGAYSEGLGYTAKEFIQNYPKDFTSFFDNKSCFTDSDLEIWANILVLEFAIDSDGEYDKPIIDQFINKLKSNCKECSSTQKETINKFGLTLNQKWKEYVKSMN
ncbi:MAG: hypothetical protein KGZ81_13840 [Flavobacteriales bacterium]|nr:hypothetical protein [Flavobacteriales bacterium]